jgi:hypothetical protein
LAIESVATSGEICGEVESRSDLRPAAHAVVAAISTPAADLEAILFDRYIGDASIRAPAPVGNEPAILEPFLKLPKHLVYLRV